MKTTISQTRTVGVAIYKLLFHFYNSIFCGINKKPQLDMNIHFCPDIILNVIIAGS